MDCICALCASCPYTKCLAYCRTRLCQNTGVLVSDTQSIFWRIILIDKEFKRNDKKENAIEKQFLIKPLVRFVRVKWTYVV